MAFATLPPSVDTLVGILGACIGAGLVGGEGFAVDASLIVVDANKQRSTPGPRWNKELDAEAVSRTRAPAVPTRWPSR